MKRIVWIAATILIMICILGYGLHTLNKIDEVNKKRREKQAGKALASQIVMTTATESIWDRLRATTEVSTETGTAGEAVSPDSENGEVPTEAVYDGQDSPIVPDAPAQTPVQTNTVTDDGAVVIID